MCRIKGEKAIKPSLFNPYGEMLFSQSAKEIINPEAARTFLQLTAEGKAPSWTINYLDLELVKAAAR